MSFGYEKNRESFDLYAAKFESGAMRFWREKSPRRWNPSKQGFHPCPSIIKNSQRRTEIHWAIPFFIRTPPIEGPGFLRGRGGVLKGRFCGGNCVGTFDLLLNSEGGHVSAL